jgi:hypothetical protein
MSERVTADARAGPPVALATSTAGLVLCSHAGRGLEHWTTGTTRGVPLWCERFGGQWR